MTHYKMRTTKKLNFKEDKTMRMSEAKKQINNILDLIVINV